MRQHLNNLKTRKTNLSDNSELAKEQVWIVPTKPLGSQQYAVLFIQEELKKKKMMKYLDCSCMGADIFI